MANNYTQFSILLTVKKPELVDAISKFLEDVENIDDIMHDGEEPFVPPTELISQEDVEWVFNNIKESGGIGGWQHADGELHVFEEECPNLDVVSFILQKLLIADAIEANYKHGIVITWANTCSKMRPDEFSGGACYITKDEIHWQPDVIGWIESNNLTK